MADLPVPKNYGVEATRSVKEKWYKVQIQEIKSRIARLALDIEDLEKGKILQLKAEMEMQELRLQKFEDELKNLDAIDAS